MRFANWDMLDLVARIRHPESYLEIGVSSGDSLGVVLNACKPSRIVLCDNWSPDYKGHQWRNHRHIAEMLEAIGYHGKVMFIDGDSHELIKQLPENEKFHLIHIDGDHSEAGALQDMEDSWRVVTDFGFMVVDDLIHTPAVDRALEKFLKNHPEAALVKRDMRPDGCALVSKQ